MAHKPEIIRKVRTLYTIDCLDLTVIATLEGLSLATIKKWKFAARHNGDCWDKARTAHELAKGDIKEVVGNIATSLLRKGNYLLEEIDHGDYSTKDKVQMMATLGDSLTKATSSLRKFSADVDKLTVQLETINKFAEFIAKQHPNHKEAFAEVLEDFGEYLEHG